MNEPRRLSQSGGVSQRLLDSASIDKPSAAARRRAALLAATASSFSTTSSRSSATQLPRSSVVKTLATWIVIGAAASATLALAGSKLLDSSRGTARDQGAAPTLAELPLAPTIAPAASPDIAAEPKRGVPEPTLAASAEELREIEAARAAVGRGDEAGAIAELDGYDKAHPDGPLKTESTALRIEALYKSGKTAEARALSIDFQNKYPTHPLVKRVRALGQ